MVQGREKSLGINPDLTQPGTLWPEWSPNNRDIAVVVNESVRLLSVDAASLDDAKILGDIIVPQGEFSPDLHLLRWSADGTTITSYQGVTFTIQNGGAANVNADTGRSYDGRYQVTCESSELLLRDLDTMEVQRLTHNREAMLANQAAQPGTAYHAPTAVAAVADGFDYPVAKPNGSGYNTTAGCWWLQRTGACAPGPHPGQDFNKDCGGDCELGEPVYAVANGAVVDSDYYTPNWGNIVLDRTYTA